MSLIVKLRDGNIYIRYNRENIIDQNFARIRSKIFYLVDKEAIPNKRNIIIDYGDKDILNSPEIGIIAYIARELNKANLKLTILASNKLNENLLKTSINTISNLSIGINKH